MFQSNVRIYQSGSTNVYSFIISFNSMILKNDYFISCLEVMKYVLCNAVVHHGNHKSTANVDSFHNFLWKTLGHDSLDLQTRGIFATQKYVDFSVIL